MVNAVEIAPMMTISEVAEVLHVHSNTVRRWCDSGILRYYRISRRGDRRFRQEDIAELVVGLYAQKGNVKAVKTTWMDNLYYPI